MMIQLDDVEKIGYRLAEILSHFLDREGARAALEEAGVTVKAIDD